MYQGCLTVVVYVPKMGGGGIRGAIKYITYCEEEANKQRSGEDDGW